MKMAREIRSLFLTGRRLDSCNVLGGRGTIESDMSVGISVLPRFHYESDYSFE